MTPIEEEGVTYENNNRKGNSIVVYLFGFGMICLFLGLCITCGVLASSKSDCYYKDCRMIYWYNTTGIYACPAIYTHSSYFPIYNCSQLCDDWKCQNVPYCESNTTIMNCA